MASHLVLVTVLAGALAAAAAILAFPVLWQRRRRAIAATPLRPGQRDRLASVVPLYRRLDDAERRRYEGCIQLFLNEKRFHGCGGIEVTGDMRLAVAGHACLLSMWPEADVFPGVREILIYPAAFWVHHGQPDELGLVNDDPDLLAGEAWEQGRVILAWDDIEAAIAGAPHNVVVHEFAHALDYEPPPRDPAFAGMLEDAYQRLRQAGSEVLDDYGAESPEEFFPVACEAFVQRPAALAAEYPSLYRALAARLGLDPAARRAARPSSW